MSEKPRFIYRAKRDHDNPYFQYRRATAQDRNLTFEARGMLAYLLSQPDHWKVQPKDLEQQCKKSVVYRVLNELIRCGYIERTQERDAQKKIVAWNYVVHEEPLPKKQEVAFQEVEKLEVENQDIRDKRIEERKEYIHTNKPRNPSTSKQKRNPNLVRWDKVAAIGNELLRVFKNDFVPVEHQTFAALEPYLIVAEDLTAIGAPIEHIEPLYKYVAARAERENWNGFTVKALSKYYTDFLKEWNKKNATAARPAPAPEPEVTEAQRAELLEAVRMIRPDWEALKAS